MADEGEKIGVEDARREIAGGDATKPLEEGARLLVIADDGKSAVDAASKLSDQGYDAVAVEGGMDDWVSEDYRIQPTADPDEDTELGLN